MFGVLVIQRTTSAGLPNCPLSGSPMAASGVVRWVHRALPSMLHKTMHAMLWLLIAAVSFKRFV